MQELVRRSIPIAGLDLGTKRIGYVIGELWLKNIGENIFVKEAGVKEVSCIREVRDVVEYVCKDRRVFVEVPVPYGRAPSVILLTAAELGIVWEFCEELICLTRPDIKYVLCGTTKAKDKDVKARLQNMMGRYIVLGDKVKLKGDAWAALSVIVAHRIDRDRCYRGVAAEWNKFLAKYPPVKLLHKRIIDAVEDDEEKIKEMLKEGEDNGMD